jgi:hypothetical protein
MGTTRYDQLQALSRSVAKLRETADQRSKLLTALTSSSGASGETRDEFLDAIAEFAEAVEGYVRIDLRTR